MFASRRPKIKRGSAFFHGTTLSYSCAVHTPAPPDPQDRGQVASPLHCSRPSPQTWAFPFRAFVQQPEFSTRISGGEAWGGAVLYDGIPFNSADQSLYCSLKPCQVRSTASLAGRRSRRWFGTGLIMLDPARIKRVKKEVSDCRNWGKEGRA